MFRVHLACPAQSNYQCFNVLFYNLFQYLRHFRIFFRIIPKGAFQQCFSNPAIYSRLRTKTGFIMIPFFNPYLANVLIETYATIS